jgi:hypothetical protein
MQKFQFSNKSQVAVAVTRVSDAPQSTFEANGQETWRGLAVKHASDRVLPGNRVSP